MSTSPTLEYDGFSTIGNKLNAPVTILPLGMIHALGSVPEFNDESLGFSTTGKND